MAVPKPEIRATITLLPTEQGGRRSGLPSGAEYRTVLGAGGEHFSARFIVENALEPGGSTDVEIQFLFPEAALPKFPVGATFTIWEGRDIGTGRVTSLIVHD